MPISGTIEQVPWDAYVFTDSTTGDIIFRSISSNNFIFGFNQNVPSTFSIKQGTGSFITGTSNFPAQLTFQRARTTNASLQTNDQTGSINFSGRFGVSATSNFANISSFYTGTGTTKSGNITFNTESNFGMTERIRITDAGNLGVGTSAPTGIATFKTSRRTPRQLSFNNPTTINVWYDQNTLFTKYGTNPWIFETSSNVIVALTFTSTTTAQTRTVSMSYNLNGVWTAIPSDGSILSFYTSTSPQGGAITVNELENSGSFSVIDRIGNHTTLCATSNGLVGISTSNPSYALDVSTPSNSINLSRFGRMIASTQTFFQPVANPINSNAIQSICTIVNAKWGAPITIHLTGAQNESMTSIIARFAANYSMGSNWWKISPQTHDSFSSTSFLPRLLVRGFNANNNIEIAIAREGGTQVSTASNMWAMVQSFENSVGLSFSNSSANTYLIQNTEYNNIPYYRQTTFSNESFQAVASNALFTSGLVGIGRSNPGFALDVQGDINFSGAFRQNGVPYVGSQWSTSNNNIFLTASNVGIGTSNPQRVLHVTGDVQFDSNVFLTNSQLSVTSLRVGRRGGSTTNVTSIVTQIPGYSWDSNITLTSATGSNIFLNASSTRTSNMIIDSLINMTNNVSYASPSSNATLGGSGDRIVLRAGVTSNHPYSIGLETNALWRSVPSGARHLWYVGGTPLMSLNSNLLTVTQDICAFGSVSDSNLKTDIFPITTDEAHDKVMALKPVHFRWKNDVFNESYKNRTDIGFIAQDIEPIIPEAIQQMPVGENIYKSIKYERILPYIVSLLQKQQSRIDYLESELKKLTDPLQ